MRRFHEILGLGEHDVRYEGLRVAIVEREPGGLDLHHDAVAGEERVAHVRQTQTVRQDLSSLDRLRFRKVSTS